jgi:purine-binding chemotaxis protein CheW
MPRAVAAPSVRGTSMVGEIGSAASRDLSLLVRAGARACALPMAHAVETMRPRPIEGVAGAPAFVLGLSIIRGDPLPVVHLGRLLGDAEVSAVSRFVTLRLGRRSLALAVQSVVGALELDSARLTELPPVLGAESDGVVAAIGQLDAELLVVLRTMRIVPEPLWDALLAGKSAP